MEENMMHNTSNEIPTGSVHELPHTWLSKHSQRIVSKLTGVSVWLWPLLMAVIIINVLLRHLFGEGRIELEELQWHIYAAGWLLGLTVCYVANEHVRVDLLYGRFSLKKKCWVELLGTLAFLLPFIAVVIIYSVPFVQYSWQSSEVSTNPGGLPYRWFIKSVLLISFCLFLTVVCARLSQLIKFLFLDKNNK